MFHGIPDERADYNLDIYLPTKGLPADDMPRTLCLNLNVMAMANFPLVLASEKFLEIKYPLGEGSRNDDDD